MSLQLKKAAYCKMDIPNFYGESNTQNNRLYMERNSPKVLFNHYTVNDESPGSPPQPNKKKCNSTFARRGGGTFNTGPRERQFALEIPAAPSGASTSQNDGNFLTENPNAVPGLAVDINIDGTCPYPGWKLYFPHEGVHHDLISLFI